MNSPMRFKGVRSPLKHTPLMNDVYTPSPFGGEGGVLNLITFLNGV
jgi:hypothetical protein